MGQQFASLIAETGRRCRALLDWQKTSPRCSALLDLQKRLFQHENQTDAPVFLHVLHTQTCDQRRFVKNDWQQHAKTLLLNVESLLHLSLLHLEPMLLPHVCATNVMPLE